MNIVIVISKADFLTPNESKALKTKILQDLNEEKIQVYTLPECEPDDDNDYKVNRQ